LADVSQTLSEHVLGQVDADELCVACVGDGQRYSRRSARDVQHSLGICSDDPVDDSGPPPPVLTERKQVGQRVVARRQIGKQRTGEGVDLRWSSICAHTRSRRLSYMGGGPADAERSQLARSGASVKEVA